MLTIDRREFLKKLSIGAAGTVAFTLPGLNCSQKKKKPNVVFILADDLGYGDLGCCGQTMIQTPRLDTLAEEGIRFTQAYSGSTVCAPSRCSLLTGKHTGHTTVRDNKSHMGIGAPDSMKKRISLAVEDVTIAEVLKQAGYVTGIFGKWGLVKKNVKDFPTRHGFDEFFGKLLVEYGSPKDTPNPYWHNEEAAFTQPPYFIHDYYTDRALEFIEQNRSKPFFLFLSYQIPHAQSGNMPDGTRLPHDSIYAEKELPDYQKHHATLITRMDHSVGKVLDLLTSLKLESNTLVIFSSDNGPHKEDGNDPDFFNSNGPLRGIKRDLYEGGIRVPTLAWWPGTIQAGTVSDHVWAFWDVLPTCAELAGVIPPDDIDGVSIAPVFFGKSVKEHEYLYWEILQGGFRQAVRMGDWKAVRFTMKNESTELYDLKTDIGEEHNIADRYPDVVKQIETVFAMAHTDSEHWPTTRWEGQ